jgi:hypothetical protein
LGKSIRARISSLETAHTTKSDRRWILFLLWRFLHVCNMLERSTFRQRYFMTRKTKAVAKPRPPAKRPRRQDVNVTAEALVRAVTGTERANGEEMLESPELKRILREAKAKDAAKRKK